MKNLLATMIALLYGATIAYAEVPAPAQSDAADAWNENIPFPGGEISTADILAVDGGWTLSTSALAAHFTLENGMLRLSALENKLTGEKLPWLDPQLFTLHLEGKTLNASEMKWVEGPKVVSLKGSPHLARLAQRIPGKALTGVMEDATTGLRVQWSAILRDGSNYLRQEITLTTIKPVKVAEIELIRARVPNAEVSGYTDGAPVVAGNWFLGIEHPMSKVNCKPPPPNGQGAKEDPLVVATWPRQFTLTRDLTWRISTGIGAAPHGQLRRAFAYYLQRERAHPYRQYWHYNSWFDLNIGRNENPDPLRRMNEQDALQVVKTFSRELFDKRGVGLNGFVWDDGWDDWNTLWRFHKGFPNGFVEIAKAAKQQGAGIGAWLSPWGGYGNSQRMRVNFGRTKGYETNGGGFALSGPKYYAAFRDSCLGMIKDCGANYFKFDGIGGGMWATGASANVSADLDGLLRMIADLREADPDLFINATVGTWASPYWTLFADSIWRQGEDCAFSGTGNARERWITYKDAIVYDRFASRSPLFPMNSMMYHGLVVGSTFNPGQMPPPAKDLLSFQHEMRMASAYSSGLGELYVSPSLITPEAWDCMAECIRWSRAKREVVVDTHWIGGSPGKNEIYGFAAWHPIQGGVVTLRNPSDKVQTFALKIEQVFELTAGISKPLTLRSPWQEDAPRPPISAEMGKAIAITLQPFEVLTLESQVAKLLGR